METNKKFDYIVQQLSKLDKIESKLDKLENTVVLMDVRIKNVETKTVAFEKSVEFVSGKVDDFEQRANSIDKRVEDKLKDQTTEIRGLTGELNDAKQTCEDLRQTCINLQARSMRDNLLFHGLPEDVKEDPETVVTDLFVNKLDIEGGKDILLERVHRLGPKRKDKIRPIVAKFNSYKDRERVRKSSSKLAETTIGISEQFPREIQEIRKKLIPVMKDALKMKRKAVLSFDKLYIDGVLYKPGETTVRRPTDHVHVPTQ